MLTITNEVVPYKLLDNFKIISLVFILFDCYEVVNLIEKVKIKIVGY